MRTSILIVDSQRMVREVLRGILEQQSGFQVVADAEDATQAVEAARRVQPQIALVETHLGVHCGIETIRQIREASPRTRCIALSGHKSPTYVSQSLAAGASGFVPKHSGARELVEAVHVVRSGRSYLAPSIADHVVGAITAKGRAAHHGGITGRQREVLRLIAHGCTIREIAAQLGISEKTAQTHRANLMGKIGVHKTSALVRYAVREGIVAA